jgi:phage shock protein PspC (stress-responsive transcriptional regulator)
MKKTIQIHLGGFHFHCNEDAYHELQLYFESLKLHFASDKEAGKEIVDDIEQRMGELLQNKISGSKQCIGLDDLNEAMQVLGKIEDFMYTSSIGAPTEAIDDKNGRRLFRDSANRYIGGVAAGIGEYFNLDPLWIRLAFIALSFVNGLGILIYAILWVAVPAARTTSEKLQMKGMPITISTIKESVNQEYEKVKSSFSHLSKSSSADRTRTVLENIVRAVGLIILAVFKVIIISIGIVFILVGLVFLSGLVLAILGISQQAEHFQLWDHFHLNDFAHLLASPGYTYLMVVCLFILVFIPVIGLIYGGIKLIFQIRSHHRTWRIIFLALWMVAFFCLLVLLISHYKHFSVESTENRSTVVMPTKARQLYIQTIDNLEHKPITQYSVLGHTFISSKWDESLYLEVNLSIQPSEDDKIHLVQKRHAFNTGFNPYEENLSQIGYHWLQNDSVLQIDRYFSIRSHDFWIFPSMDICISVPAQQSLSITPQTCHILTDSQQAQYCTTDSLKNKRFIVDPDGTWKFGD